jgi:hypothetical protein
MAAKLPSKLYKYQPLTPNSYTLRNLTAREIWFSKPGKLNDPFDCAIPFRLVSASPEEWRKGYEKFHMGVQNDEGATRAILADRKYLTNGKPNQAFRDDIIKTNIKNVVSRVDNYRNEGIACFSATLNNILMWSHYADGHKGICLEFDTKYPPFNDVHKVLRVIYQTIYPALNPVQFLILGRVPATPLITKSTHWKYEKEWRLLKAVGDTAVQYDPRALTAIYFGCLMPDDQKDQIAAMPATSAPRLFSMKRSEKEFKLETEPYVK